MAYHPLGKNFAQLTKAYVALVASALQHLDIERYYYVLFVLAQAEKPLNQKELACLAYTDKPNLVRIVDYLVAHNCVKRVLNPNDRREQFIELTIKGAQHAVEIEAAYRKVAALFVTGLSATQTTTLTESLEMMTETTANSAQHHVTLKFKTPKIEK